MAPRVDTATSERPAADVAPATKEQDGRDVTRSLRLNQQQRLITEELYKDCPDKVVPFNLVIALRLNGPLNIRVLERALRRVINHHSVFRGRVLRTSAFGPQERRRLACVAACTGIPTTALYVARLENTEVPCTLMVHQLPRKVDVRSAVNETVWPHAIRPFDYDSVPLIRSVLLRRTQRDHYLVFIAPHLIADRWSMRILSDDVLQEYESLEAASGARMLSQRCDFYDFVEWENASLATGAVFDAAMAYWSRRWYSYRSAQISRDVFTRAKLSVGSTRESETVTTWLDARATEAIRTVGRRLATTPYVIFRAGMCVALHGVTRQDRLALWGNFANRRHNATVRGVGWYNNPHIVAIECTQSSTGEDVINATRQAIAEALEHQELPLLALWQKLGKRLDWVDCHVALDWHWPLQRKYRTLAVTEMEDVADGLPIADLKIRVVYNNGICGLKARYPKALYSRDGIAELLNTSRRCMATLVTEPSRKISHYRGGGV